MHPFLTKSGAWLRRRAENVAAGMLGVMFVAFIIQIVFRYFFNFPIGWTSELSVITWLCMVLLGLRVRGSKESEEIRFDLISGQLGPRGRRVIGLIVALALVVLYGMSLPADARSTSRFMKVESSSYLKIRLDLLYSIYVVFAVAIIVALSLGARAACLRGKEPEEADITKASSGPVNPTSPFSLCAHGHRRA